MCGIAGILNLNGGTVDSDELVAMMTRLKHRGPDGSGLYVDGPLGLAQTRLAVIDVEGGVQPMFNEDRTVVLVFNGEIYNFQEIRRDLEKDHRFATKSDTEVIVHLYEEEGIDSLRRFRGMFALAIWDVRKKRLFLARDRVGQKPLYYSLGAGGAGRFLFGSEIKALLACGVGSGLNLGALDLFFKNQFISGPETIYEDIQSLPPAHYMVIDQGGFEIKRYWEPPASSDRKMSEEAYAEALRETLSEAVRLRLISDVPLGAFLSGGIDSSLIVGLMREGGVSSLNTFSVGFKEESFDETPFAIEASTHFKTDHHAYQLDDQIKNLIPKIISSFDQPFGDSSSIAVYHLSEVTRRSVTVALSGDGSDELFAGYRRYVGRRLLKYYWAIPRPIREKWIEKILDAMPEGTSYYGKSLIRQFKLFAGSSRRLEEDPLDLLPATFTRKELDLLYTPRVTAFLEKSRKDCQGAWAERLSSLDEISQMMWVDFHRYLPDDILVKVDRMSMAHGLEVRCPFLDQEVVSFAMKMPVHLKLKNLETKYLLKRAFQGMLPPRIVKRKKHGFMLPLGSWFKNGLRSLIEEVLLKPDKMGLFNLPYINQLVEEHQRGKRDHSQKLWLLLVYRLWEKTASQ
ncbi:MAG: asparagine synthase (glutamine-hydrolyzing) [Nitrospira sp.]|nr:asparagine synthase (glutamine-hydrolyzing) [Candidatus Manganitrophaceae bacterium]HIL35449.1 asparagine synthase (glutamine-hydrolyzing) [Candidatus Manganitrophaceae bacterium]